MISKFLGVLDYTLFHATIRASTPILFAALSACLTQQANILNVGIEGVMLSSAFTAVAVSFLTGSWVLALIAAILVGVAISWVIGVAHLDYNADVFAVGTVINLLALAITKFFLNEFLGTTGSFQSPDVVPLPTINIPMLNDNPVLNSLFNNYSLLEIFGLITVFVMWYMLFKTRWGLRVRAVGQSPMAAQTAGIEVYKTKFRVVLLSGILGGLAGAHLSLGYSNIFVENMTNGRGFMGVAAMFFGGMNPVFAWVGTLLFGFVDSVGSRLQAYGVASQFILMIPYIVTIAVLSISMVVSVKKKEKSKSTLL